MPVPAGPSAKTSSCASQRLDVGVLRGVAGPHRAALAGRDLVEDAASRRCLGRKQHALEGALLDRAVDVAERQRRAVADALVQPLQHAPRLLGGLGRAFDDDAVAVDVGDDAEPALEMGEVLVVLAEHEAGEAVVLEGQGDLGRLLDARDESWRRSRAPVSSPRSHAVGSASNRRSPVHARS